MNMRNALLLLFTCSLYLLFSCQNHEEKPTVPLNILWISTEDIGCTLPLYGDSTVRLPNLERLAKEGVVYEQAFTAAGVCAPSRSSIISGMYPVSLGTHHMRTTGVEVPEQVLGFPQYLRRAGYYCSNNLKTDYNFAVPDSAWDANGLQAHWRMRKPGQPFFAVFNFTGTHESQIWHNQFNTQPVEPNHVPVPSYLPETKHVREDIARNYANILELDAHIGHLLGQLEADGLLESTLILFWSDHGGPLPRQKRELYDAGIHVPLVVRYPKHMRGQAPANTRTNRLVSLMDLGPSMLSVVGIRPPEYMQGQAFLGEYVAPERQFVFAHRDRMDHEYDMVRAVRNKKWKYIRNYFPELPSYQPIQFRMQMRAMQEIARMQRQNELPPQVASWFKPKKVAEELYNLEADPYEQENLANDPRYAGQLAEMRRAFQEWTTEIKDLGVVPEPEMHLIQELQQMPLYEYTRMYPEQVRRWQQAADLSLRTNPEKEQVVQLLTDPDPVIRYWAVRAAAKTSLPAEGTVSPLLYDRSEAVRLQTAVVLGRRGDNTLLIRKVFQDVLADKQGYGSLVALNAVREFPEIIAYLRPEIEKMEDGKGGYHDRAAAITLSGQIP